MANDPQCSRNSCNRVSSKQRESGIPLHMPKSKGNACNAYFFSISLPRIFCDLDEGDEGYMHALKHKVASMEWSVIDLHLFCVRFVSACFVVVSTPREIDPEETE